MDDNDNVDALAKEEAFKPLFGHVSSKAEAVAKWQADKAVEWWRIETTKFMQSFCQTE